MMRTLDIWWDARLVGHLTQDRHGDLGFVYAPAWLDDEAAQHLSASLPKRAEPFSRRECRPFFGGLLPEEGQRDAAAQALGVSRANDFALLERLGGDGDGGHEGVSASVVAGVDATPVLEPSEHDLDLVALLVEGSVVVDLNRPTFAGGWIV